MDFDFDAEAQKYIESFISGNREHVIRDLARDSWSRLDAVALSARIAVGLPEAYRGNFLYLTAYYAKD